MSESPPFFSTRWVSPYSFTSTETNHFVAKSKHRWHMKKQFSQHFSKFKQLDEPSQSKISKLSRLWVRLWGGGGDNNKNTHPTKLPSIVSERIHKSHSVSAFFPSPNSNDTPLENIFSPMVDEPMDTIDTIQEVQKPSLAINKKDCRNESNFFNSDFFKDSARPIIDYDDSQITD